jgi:hypothetical protein
MNLSPKASKALVFFLSLMTTLSVGYVFYKAYNWPAKSYAVQCQSLAGPTMVGRFTSLEIKNGYINTDIGPYFPGPYEMCNIQVTFSERN